MDTPILEVDGEASVADRLTDNVRQNVLPARYLLKNSSGEVTETPAEMFERVARNVAEAEAEYSGGLNVDEAEERFEEMIKELRFMPNSPTLMNADTAMNQLSACFVLEPEDKMAEENGSAFGDGIFPTATEASKIFQSGGGVGYPFHHIRPKGHYINSTGGKASGPVSFMHVFDVTCGTVEQGGQRRGAQMGILRVDHPDIGRFITAKRDEGELDNFNISVGVTDSFINAVENGESYVLSDPTEDYDEAYEVTEAVADFYNYEYRNNPETAFEDKAGKTVGSNIWRDYADGIECKENGVNVTLEEKWARAFDLEEGDPLELPAEFIWDIMIDGAHRNGEPGIFYYDWTQEDHTFPEEDSSHDIEGTNPCAEQPLSEYEACNLGHVNLSLMVEEDAPTYEEWCEKRGRTVESYVEKALDQELFHETIETGTRFLENVVEQSDFPLEEIEEKVANMRKIGIGVMGMAQMLYQMGVAYDSETGRDISAEVLRIVNRQSTLLSQDLAWERGSFGDWEDSKWSDPQANEEWFERHTGGLDADNYPRGYPIRNHNTTTIAPTGTTSMIGDTSGGCEPVYSVCYYKNVGDDIQGDDFLVEFDSYFLNTLAANDIPINDVKAEAEAQMEADEWDGVNGLETVPDEFGDVFVTTEQISAEDHALMQRRLQEHVDSGISKTINLPEEATRNDVDDAYRLALSRNSPGVPAKGVTVYRDKSRDEQVKSTTADMDEAGSSNDIEGDTAPDPIELYQSDEWSDEDAREFIDAFNVDEAQEEDEPELESEGFSIGYRDHPNGEETEKPLIEQINDGDAEICPECGDGILEMKESCSLCPNCGYSPCS